MAPPRPRFDAWPLLPRPVGDARARPVDEPVRAAATALAILAGLFLALRWLLPGSGLAREVAALVALWGSLGGFALTLVILSLLVGTAVVTPLLPPSGPLKDAGLAAFDHALHLAFVLTSAGLVGMIVLHGTIPPAAAWFAGQALLLWGFHRTRLWLTGGSPA